MTHGNDDPFAPSRPSVSFRDARVGESRSGTVLELPELVQSRDFESGQPAFWPDGNKKMAVVVPVRLADGSEAAFWCAKPSSMFAAISEAQRAAGQRIKVGGTLVVTYVGDKANENPRLNAAKQYKAVYTPPADDPFGTAAVDAPTATSGPATPGLADLYPAPAAPTPVVKRPADEVSRLIGQLIEAGMPNEAILKFPAVRNAGVSAAQVDLVRTQGPY